MIVFALLSTGAIKICYGVDCASRIEQLKEKYDEPVELLAVSEGDPEAKRAIHRQFSHLRFDATEQFRPGSDLLAYIGCEDRLWDDDGFDWSEPLPSRRPTPRSGHPTNDVVSCEETRKKLVNPLDLEGMFAWALERRAGRVADNSIEHALFFGLIDKELTDIDEKWHPIKRFDMRAWRHLASDLVPDGWSSPSNETHRRTEIIDAAMGVLLSLGLVEMDGPNVCLPFRLRGHLAPTPEWHLYARFYRHFPFIEPPRAFSYQEYLASEHWDEVRRRELRFARYACRLCGSKGTLHVHHRSYENLGCERSSDLIVLCCDCHSRFHQQCKLADDPKFAHSMITWNAFYGRVGPSVCSRCGRWSAREAHGQTCGSLQEMPVNYVLPMDKTCPGLLLHRDGPPPPVRVRKPPRRAEEQQPQAEQHTVEGYAPRAILKFPIG